MEYEEAVEDATFLSEAALLKNLDRESRQKTRVEKEKKNRVEREELPVLHLLEIVMRKMMLQKKEERG